MFLSNSFPTPSKSSSNTASSMKPTTVLPARSHPPSSDFRYVILYLRLFLGTILPAIFLFIIRPTRASSYNIGSSGGNVCGAHHKQYRPRWVPQAFFFLATPSSLRDLSSPVPRAGIKPVPPAVETQSLNHWTAREVPAILYNDLWAPCLLSYLYNCLLSISLRQVLVWFMLVAYRHLAQCSV